MRCLAVSLVLLLATSAAADDRVAQIKSQMRAQADALIAEDEAAFAKTLATDPRIDVGDGQAPSGGVSLQTDLMNPSEVVFGQTRAAWFGTWGYAAAEVQLRNRPHPEGMQPGKTYVMPLKMRHWIAVFVLENGAVKTKFLVLQQTMPDKELAGYTYVDKLPKPAALGATLALIEHPADAVKLLAKDAVGFGTSAADRGFGAVAAAKLMRSWAKLTFTVVDEDLDHPFELTVGDATIAWAEVKMSAKYGIPLSAVAITRTTPAGKELLVFAFGAR